MSVKPTPLMNAAHIMADTVDEVNRQVERWGTEADDSKNTPWHWATYITGYATRWMAGTWSPLGKDTTDQFRHCMIKAAALAISAAASVDRQRETAGKTFFE